MLVAAAVAAASAISAALLIEVKKPEMETAQSDEKDLAA